MWKLLGHKANNLSVTKQKKNIERLQESGTISQKKERLIKSIKSNQTLCPAGLISREGD